VPAAGEDKEEDAARREKVNLRVFCG
jgi:hypothetical protein